MIAFNSPHVTGTQSVSRVMFTVVAALVPGILCQLYFFGWGSIINCLLAVTTALMLEAGILALRKRSIGFFLKDGSIVVTALLLAVALPPLLPWWVTVLGAALAVVFGKHLFGGLGQNPFNPAMVAYALLLVSLPVLMTTRWVDVNQPTSLHDSVQIIFGQLDQIDGYTGATPLDHYKLNIAQTTADVLTEHSIYADFGAVGWTPVNLAFLVGGIALLALRIITWHIPLTLLLALAGCSFIFGADADTNVPLTLHILAGSTMLAAFFIATDPVSAATSNKGKLFYGTGIGILIYLIRTWGNYPDATAFAVLLMNFAAPLIDHYTRPRVYGHQKSVSGFKHDKE